MFNSNSNAVNSSSSFNSGSRFGTSSSRSGNNGNQFNNNNSNDFSFEINESVSVLSTWLNSNTGITNSKEINVVSWNGRQPMVDIRNWYAHEGEEKRPSKGISLNEKEAKLLCENLIKMGYGPDSQ